MTTTSSRALGRLGGLALLAVGLDHLEQFSVGHYSVVPTIGTLFVLNFVAATVIAAGLAVSKGRISLLFGIGGLGVAGGTLAGLLLSETVGLFGFTEVGYRPAIELSIALDVATIALLSLFVVSAISSAGRAPRPACPTSAAPPR
jgi:hypothetical protein